MVQMLERAIVFVRENRRLRDRERHQHPRAGQGSAHPRARRSAGRGESSAWPAPSPAVAEVHLIRPAGRDLLEFVFQLAQVELPQRPADTRSSNFGWASWRAIVSRIWAR